MNSKFLKLNWQDLAKGVIVAVLSAGVTAAYNALTSGQPVTLKSVATVGITAGLGYLLKNVFTNSDGQLSKENK